MAPPFGHLLLAACCAVAPGPPTPDGPSPAPGAKDPPAQTDARGAPLPAGAVARVGSLRFQHGGRVHFLAYSGDGKWLVSLGADERVSLWDAASGQELARLKPPDRPVRGIALSSDGRLLAVSSGKGPVSILQLPAGETRRAIGPASLEANRVAFTPDGKTLVTVKTGWGNQAQFWDVATGKELPPLPEVREPIFALVFSPDGRRMVTAREGTSVRLWEVAGRKFLRALEGADSWVWAVVFAPDGKTLAAGDARGSLHVWDVETGRRLRHFRANEELINSVAFTPNGQRLVAEANDGMARVWDVSSGKEIRPIEVGPRQDYNHAFALSPDGKTLAVGRFLRLFDVATGAERHPKVPGGGVAAYSAAGDRFLTGETALVLCTADTGVEQGRFILKDHDTVRACAWTSGGKAVAALSNTGTLYFWDADAEKVGVRRGVARKASAAFSPDGGLLAVEQLNGSVALVESGSGQERRRLRLTGSDPGRRSPLGVADLAFSPDGTTLAAAVHDSGRGFSPDATITLHLWDVATGTELPRGETDRRPLVGFISCLCFSPDGRLLASAGVGDAGRQVRLWEVATGREACRFEGSPSFVYSLAFSPDGQVLACGGDPEVRLWTAEGREVRRLAGHREEVTGLAFSPGGRRLLSASRDGTSLMWDVSGLEAPGRDKMTQEDLERRWEDLIGADARQAHRAVAALAAAPGQSVPFLRQRLRPASAPAALRRLNALIAALDDKSFKVREEATHELDALARWAAPALRNALAGRLSGEQRRRLEGVLARLSRRRPAGEELRTLRALAVLEQGGTPEGRRLLGVLAGGDATASETRAAKAALDRLARRDAVRTP
jgi:WD40 repeat protein